MLPFLILNAITSKCRAVINTENNIFLATAEILENRTFSKSCDACVLHIHGKNTHVTYPPSLRAGYERRSVRSWDNELICDALFSSMREGENRE